MSLNTNILEFINPYYGEMTLLYIQNDIPYNKTIKLPLIEFLYLSKCIKEVVEKKIAAVGANVPNMFEIYDNKPIDSLIGLLYEKCKSNFKFIKKYINQEDEDDEQNLEIKNIKLEICNNNNNNKLTLVQYSTDNFTYQFYDNYITIILNNLCNYIYDEQGKKICEAFNNYLNKHNQLS
jgi:hypothetical protein